jgi:putative addiction module component (TIGR02574 family)
MSATTEELKTQLLQLPLHERAELAQYLIDSLEAGHDPDAEAAWGAELERRAAEIRSGTAVGQPATSVFARLRSRLP